MLYIKEEHLEQKKQRQLRENIEEYLANSFCTMQTEIELLEKHIHQNPESPTYSMDSEMLQDISLRLRAMADVSSSMAAILQGDADELRARTRALPFAERLRLFCERVNWEMKDLGYVGRTMYCTESPDICVLGDPVFMEAVLVNLILGMLKLENGSGCLSVNLSKNKKQAELRLFAKGACFPENARQLINEHTIGASAELSETLRLTQAYCDAMNWQLSLADRQSGAEVLLCMPGAAAPDTRLYSRQVHFAERAMCERLHRRLLLVFGGQAHGQTAG